MKLLIVFITLLTISESFAQSRRVRRSTSHPSRTIIVNPGYGPRYTRPVIVGPRYNPNPYSRRYIRDYRRVYSGPTMILGYSCNYNSLILNGQRFIHSFTFSSECNQAISDISYYGDFCDGSDLYDQTGILEASFTFNSECRNALGWYY
jgi:hypothetical protein